MGSEDLSGIFEKLNMDTSSISPEMINGFLSMLGNPKNDNNEIPHEENNTYEPVYETSSSDSSGSTSATGGIDIDMLMKMKSMIDKMNVKEDDPRSNLLLSLKPYLKDSRKDKLDQYVQLMNMSKMIDFLPFLGGGKKKDD